MYKQFINMFLSRVGIFCNEDTRFTLLDPKLIFGEFCNILVHLRALRYSRKLSAKWAELVQLMQQSVQRSHVVSHSGSHSQDLEAPCDWKALCDLLRSEEFKVHLHAARLESEATSLDSSHQGL